MERDKSRMMIIEERRVRKRYALSFSLAGLWSGILRQVIGQQATLIDASAELDSVETSWLIGLNSEWKSNANRRGGEKGQNVAASARQC